MRFLAFGDGSWSLSGFFFAISDNLWLFLCVLALFLGRFLALSLLFLGFSYYLWLFLVVLGLFPGYFWVFLAVSRLRSSDSSYFLATSGLF